MSVASFVAAQRTNFGVPHAVTCRTLEVSESWFYKWRDRSLTSRQARRRALDADVKRSFDESDGDYGSPRVRADLRAWGWEVSKKTVEASMARQGLVGRATRRRFRCLTRPDKAAPPAPDLVKRDFTASAINAKWCGDLTEVPTDEGKLYLAPRRGPGVAADPRLRPLRASRRGGRGGRVADGRRRARRRRRRGDLPFGSGQRTRVQGVLATLPC
jgi:putative transposase